MTFYHIFGNIKITKTNKFYITRLFKKMKKYVKIYNKIKGDITDGSISFGQKLPSKRISAELFNSSVITVETAYGILESEGYIEARERSGYYVCYSASETINETARQTSDLSFGINDRFLKENAVKNAAESEYFSFTAYSQSLKSALNDFGETLTKKTPVSGAFELRHAIKNYLKTSRNIATSENNIVIGAGAEYLYGLIIKILGTNITYAIESPSYEKIEKVYELNGVKPEKLKLGKNGILWEELKKSNAQILHVTPYRSYPTGVTASASKKAEYLLKATEKRGYIIEDDYESEFSLSAHLTETLFGKCTNDRVIYVNTFSKTIFPSIRTAYMILPIDLAARFYDKFGDLSCPVPALEQFTLAKIIADGSFTRHLNRVRRARRKKQPPL